MNKQAYESSVARVLNKKAADDDRGSPMPFVNRVRSVMDPIYYFLTAGNPNALLAMKNTIKPMRRMADGAMWRIKDILTKPEKQLPDVYYKPVEPGRQIYKVK